VIPGSAGNFVYFFLKDLAPYMQGNDTADLDNADLLYLQYLKFIEVHNFKPVS
jgi:hypothetical protein